MDVWGTLKRDRGVEPPNILHEFTYSMPVTTGGEHLGYISKKSHEGQCIPAKGKINWN